MNKPIILFFPFPLLSHYSRCLMVAKDIKEDFEIHFASSVAHDPMISEFGFPSFKVENFDPQVVLDQAKKFSFDWLSEQELTRVFLSQVECIKYLKPNLVIGDAAFTLKMAAEKTGVKMIGLINGYMSPHYALTRTIPHSHPAYLYSKRTPERIFNGIVRFMEKKTFRKVHQPFNKIRKQYSLTRIKNYLDELTGDSTLICDLPGLFPQKKLPPDFHFLGPIFFQSEDDETQLVSKLDSSKPVLLVSMGSTGEWERLKILQSVKFSHINIITAGDEKKVLTAPHIISKTFVNNHAIMPYVDVMVCHGGNGTIYQALAHNVPVVAVTSIFEQEWNMHRITQLGLGEWLNDLEAEKLLSCIMRWIQKRPATNFANEIARYHSVFRRAIIKRIAEE